MSTRTCHGRTCHDERKVHRVADELPDLLYSDAERALSDALASLLADRGGLDKALARTESAQTYDDKLWQAVAADLGCAGLLIPERDGGAGASYREAAAAAEALGSFVAPVPFLGSAVVATAALLSVASALRAVASDSSASSGTPFTPAKVAADLLAPDGGRRRDHGAGDPVRHRARVPAFPASVRVAGPRPGDAAAGVARLRGMVTGVADALPAGCCSSRPTACRTGCTWSTCRRPAWPRRR